MDEFLEILIFVIIVIANIIGAVIKAKKKAAEKKLASSPVDDDENYYEEGFKEEYFNAEDYQHITPTETFFAIRNVPFPATTEKNAPCPDCPPCHADSISTAQTLEVVEDFESDENFDYGEFMRTHGREAFILAEIILPANSRQGS